MAGQTQVDAVCLVIPKSLGHNYCKAAIAMTTDTPTHEGMKMKSADPTVARPASLTGLFVTFTLLALQGFGGVLAVSQRVLCEQKRWLTRSQFVEVLAMSNVLPGPNVCNLALIVGDRYFGWRGAFTALAGMMVVPLLILLALTTVYARIEFDPAVVGALKGMGAVSAGLIIGTGLSLARTLAGNAMRTPACILIGAATFVAVALLHWPVWSCLGIGLLACAYAWHRIGKTTTTPQAEQP
jgi:chromate transporter